MSVNSGRRLVSQGRWFAGPLIIDALRAIIEGKRREQIAPLIDPECS